MTVDVTDGDLTSQCAVLWNVITGAPFVVSMSSGNGQGEAGVGVGGRFNTMHIGLGDIDVNAGLGGFDLRVVFDASVLNFQRADRGDIYAECEWEYFTYRVVNNGELHLIGIADQNDGPNHPLCGSPTPYVGTLPTTLASMTFLAADVGIVGGQCVPVRFYWVDCEDNILSDAAGEALLGAKVFDAGNPTPVSDPSAILPTLLGLPQSCVDMTTAERAVDYTNGSFCFILPTDGEGARGDINVNGLPNEIADGVMFTNFFISGLAAFLSHVPESIAASDVNADGLTLTVSDLVYLIRVIVGDAPAIPKVDPVVASYTFDRDVLSVSGGSMGAAHIVIRGDVVPKLLADGMDMGFAYDGENTNVLVYSGLTNSVRNGFEGDFLQTTGEIVEVDLATYEGSPVATKLVPSDYSLDQNYPNPFNPSTVISMALPFAGEYSLTVFNITGQVVAEFNGVAEAGNIDIVWDASELASGVYFYKMHAGDFTATKKAVLLK
jgi:hypothetical protein